MKKVFSLAPFALAPVASAGLFTSNFENSGDIIDGSLVPWSDTRTLSIPAGQVLSSVSISLEITGGFNGDLYGYLSHDGVEVTLLNRPGVGTGSAFGYSDPGLNVTFSDAATDNIHDYKTVDGYSISGGAAWKPDGRTLSPVTTSPASFDAPGTGFLGLFSGSDPNASWTLVLADVSGGGGQARVASWGLNVTTAEAVPEPAETVVAVSAALLVLAMVRRPFSALIQGTARQAKTLVVAQPR
jgi:hypothetical protein